MNAFSWVVDESWAGDVCRRLGRCLNPRMAGGCYSVIMNVGVGGRKIGIGQRCEVIACEG